MYVDVPTNTCMQEIRIDKKGGPGFEDEKGRLEGLGGREGRNVSK